jgi:hypothetical protein
MQKKKKHLKNNRYHTLKHPQWADYRSYFHLFLQVPVAAVVIMACNRADYLERTIESVLKYVLCSCSLFSTALNSILHTS